VPSRFTFLVVAKAHFVVFTTLFVSMAAVSFLWKRCKEAMIRKRKRTLENQSSVLAAMEAGMTTWMLFDAGFAMNMLAVSYFIKKQGDYKVVSHRVSAIIASVYLGTRFTAYIIYYWWPVFGAHIVRNFPGHQTAKMFFLPKIERVSAAWNGRKDDDDKPPAPAFVSGGFEGSTEVEAKPPSPPAEHKLRKHVTYDEPQEQLVSELNENNIGYQMLLRDGWRKGTGLGKNQDGVVEPVKITPNKGKYGVQCSKVVSSGDIGRLFPFTRNLFRDHKFVPQAKGKNKRGRGRSRNFGGKRHGRDFIYIHSTGEWVYDKYGVVRDELDEDAYDVGQNVPEEYLYDDEYLDYDYLEELDLEDEYEMDEDDVRVMLKDRRRSKTPEIEYGDYDGRNWADYDPDEEIDFNENLYFSQSAVPLIIEGTYKIPLATAEKLVRNIDFTRDTLAKAQWSLIQNLSKLQWKRESKQNRSKIEKQSTVVDSEFQVPDLKGRVATIYSRRGDQWIFVEVATLNFGRFLAPLHGFTTFDHDLSVVDDNVKLTREFGIKIFDDEEIKSFKDCVVSVHQYLSNIDLVEIVVRNSNLPSGFGVAAVKQNGQVQSATLVNGALASKIGMGNVISVDTQTCQITHTASTGSGRGSSGVPLFSPTGQLVGIHVKGTVPQVPRQKNIAISMIDYARLRGTRVRKNGLPPSQN